MDGVEKTSGAEESTDIKYLAKIYKEVTGQDRPELASIKDYVDGIVWYFDNLLACTPGNIFWVNKNDVRLGCNDNTAKFVKLKSRKEISVHVKNFH